MRSGLIGLFSQNLILMGVFFVIPLYLQLVLGLDALKTGIKMLPGLDHHVRDLCGRIPAVESVHGAHDRPGRAGRDASPVSLILLGTIQPTLADAGFALGMGVLGIGMGLMVSQLG